MSRILMSEKRQNFLGRKQLLEAHLRLDNETA
jgi:hypothetical protein